MERLSSETSLLGNDYCFLFNFSPIQGLVLPQQLDHLFHCGYVIIKLYSMGSLNFKNLYNSDPSFFIGNLPIIHILDCSSNIN